jgi:electron transfer flavoprotein beta subunit
MRSVFVLSFDCTSKDCGQTGTILAGLLNAPQATFASNIERGEDGTFTVERETDAGEKLVSQYQPFASLCR